jgi:predicted nucleotidyltransferase/HEPN domain-containing protein
MSEILTRARPQIDHPEALERVLAKLALLFDPVAIFLFGSRARREAWDDSDYDLMVVIRDDFPEERLKYGKWWHELRRHGIDANVSFSRESAFAWRRHEVGSVEYEVEVDGVQLYPQRPILMRSRAPDLGTGNMTIVEEWLNQVQEGLDAAVSCIHGPRVVPSRAAFHVQQAAEKLAKAALAAHRIRPDKTHEIGDVAERLPDDFPLKPRLLELERFSGYAVAFRYPGGPSVPVPAASEIEQWIAGIETLKADLERWLQARAGAGGGSERR